MPKTRYLSSFVLALCLVACGGDGTDKSEEKKDAGTKDSAVVGPKLGLEDGACSIALPLGLTEDDVRCGTLIAPENRDKPTARTVSIPFMVIKSTGDEPAPDPLLFLPGGPGEAGIARLAGMLPNLTEMRARGDLVTFDPRGTGASEPSLACPELTAQAMGAYALNLSRQEEIDMSIAATRQCHDRLVEEGVDLTGYHSAAVAADISELMQGLDYESFNVWGLSYGTRFALTLLRDAPEGVRAVILDSTLPIQANFLLERPKNAESGMDVLAAGCLANTACADALPDLKQTALDTAMRLEGEPKTLMPTNPSTGQRFPMVLNGRRYLVGGWQVQYVTEAIQYLPLLTAQTRDENYSVATQIAGAIASASGITADGVRCSTICAEEHPYSDIDLETANSGVAPQIVEAQSMDYAQMVEICKFWGAPRGEHENEAVESDVPALVLSGQYDPVLPPAYGMLAAETLSNSTFVEVPSVGHGALMAATTETARPRCAMSIGLAFLNDPSATLDTSCLEDVPAPGFLAP